MKNNTYVINYCIILNYQFSFTINTKNYQLRIINVLLYNMVNMETAKIATDNGWTTVVDKKKVKNDKRMKKKLLKEQQYKKKNYRNKNYYNNSQKLYQKKIKSEIKTIQDTPETTETTETTETPETTETTETTEKKTDIGIMTNVFSSLLNEFDESSE